MPQYIRVKQNKCHVGGDVQSGKFSIELPASHEGPLFNSSGDQIGIASISIRPPQPIADSECKQYSSTNPPKGPGDHLHDVILEQHSIEPSASCGCEAMIALMNQMGVEFCEAGREIIISRMVEQGKKQLTGSLRAIAFNLPGVARLAHREAGAMFDEAMRRSRTRHSIDETQNSPELSGQLDTPPQT